MEYGQRARCGGEKKKELHLRLLEERREVLIVADQPLHLRDLLLDLAFRCFGEGSWSSPQHSPLTFIL